jgi:glutathione S-transferase
MLDSPYVRRVAVSLQLLGLPFEHRSISVFSTFEQFRQINPVVKAPSLVCDDGTVLMDSTLILEYAENLAAPRKSLMPAGIYERNLRPAEKLHQPWVSRVTGQLLAAYNALESEVLRKPLAIADEPIDQAGITAAVAWHFTQMALPEVVRALDFPALQRFSAKAEQLPEFAAAPHGSSTYHNAG